MHMTTFDKDETNVPHIISSSPGDNRPLAIYVHGLASGAAGTTFGTLARS